VQTRDCISQVDVLMWRTFVVITGAVYTCIGLDVCWIQYVILQPSLDRRGPGSGPASEA